MPKKGADQWIQKERSVHIAALWVNGHRYFDMVEGQALQLLWDGRLERNPWTAEAQARRESEKGEENKQKDVWAQAVGFKKLEKTSKEKRNWKRTTENEHGQLMLKECGHLRLGELKFSQKFKEESDEARLEEWQEEEDLRKKGLEEIIHAGKKEAEDGDEELLPRGAEEDERRRIQDEEEPEFLEEKEGAGEDSILKQIKLLLENVKFMEEGSWAWSQLMNEIKAKQQRLTNLRVLRRQVQVSAKREEGEGQVEDGTAGTLQFLSWKVIIKEPREVSAMSRSMEETWSLRAWSKSWQQQLRRPGRTSRRTKSWCTA